MDGDLGYHLMATYVPPELMIHRNRQPPPQRKQASKISTWTTAEAHAGAAGAGASSSSCPVSTSTDSRATTTCTTSTSTPSPFSPLIIINSNCISTNTEDAVDNTDITAPTSADSVRTALDDRGVHGNPFHECDNPTLEPNTASGRPSFGDHRSRLFGRSARRRAISSSDGSSVSPVAFRANTTALDSLNPTTTSAGTAPTSVSGPAATSLATQLTPAFASPNSSGHLQFRRHTDDTIPRQNQTPIKRLHKRDPFHRKSTQQPLQLASSAEPPISATGELGIHDYHGSMSGFPILSHPYPPNSHYMPRPGSTAFANQSGIMTSNEDLSYSAERSGALSTASHATSTASRPQTQLQGPRAFVVRNGRTYINDSTLPYPLPVDLPELHRQSLRTLLMFQLFGGPILSSVFASKPPTRVLDAGCGAGFWSMMCHRYFAQHGHSSISFTGLDIVPLGGSGGDTNAKPDEEMRWRFVQHDMRQLPWPFPDNEFDLIMVKDMSFVSSFRDTAAVMEEYLRILKPGGVLESWETDSNIRMLRPHAPKNATTTIHDDDSSSDGGSNEDTAEGMGAYVMTTNTPISAPLNPYLVEYNGWLNKALEARGLSAVPCTLMGAYLLQEAESLTDVQSKRLAVPLSEIRWEREGVGGVVTKDGKSYIDSQKGKLRDQDWKNGSTLTPAQSALRRTALETTVSLILALEPQLREISGKSQEEWDTWAGKMTNDLLRDGGTSWGECLEVGVWTCRKRHSKS